jgi:hypothetical protein
MDLLVFFISFIPYVNYVFLNRKLEEETFTSGHWVQTQTNAQSNSTISIDENGHWRLI